MATVKKTAVKKAAEPKKAAAKKATSPKATAKKATPKKAAKKASSETNKLGVKNSLVNNINAKKEKGTSKPKSESSVSKKNYKDMEKDWGKK